MMLFNIIKPDMLDSPKVLEYYYSLLSKIDKFSLRELYIIKNWVSLSQLLYELDIKNYPGDKQQRRRELLTTIKGYSLCYPKNEAILTTFDLNSDLIEASQEMYRLKKEIRRQFVYDSDKHYLRYLDKDLDFSQRLSEYNIQNINVEHIVIPGNNELNDSDYFMIYFNNLHCSDPTIESIDKEFQVIRDLQIIEERNRLRR